MDPHLGECEEFPVDCPNGCEAAGETGTRQMKRGAIPLHLTECPLQRVECPYREYGCGEEMERRQLDLHEREYMHTHFRLAMKETKEMKKKVSELEREVAERDLEIMSGKNTIQELKYKISSFVFSGQLHWKIDGVRQKIESKETTFSDTIYVGLYECQGFISWNSDNIGVVGCGIRILEGSSKLLWPFLYEFKFVLVSTRPTTSNYSFSRVVNRDNLHEYSRCFQTPATSQKDGQFQSIPFISGADLLGIIFCKEDSIDIQIYVNQLPIFS